MEGKDGKERLVKRHRRLDPFERRMQSELWSKRVAAEKPLNLTKVSEG